MGFHWYIDIDEETTGKSFSAGPIILAPDEQMTVSQFVDKVNAAFLNVYEDSIHDTLYTIAARIQPMQGTSPGSGPLLNAGEHVHHHANSMDWTVHQNDSDIGDGEHPGGPMGHLHPNSPLLERSSALATAAAANSLHYDAARDSRQFIVQYRIENTANRSFKLSFATGPHGQTAIDAVGGSTSGMDGGEPPRAQITLTNTSNVQPLVVGHCKVSAMITDKPPVPPDMWFVPYRGVNDRLLVLFSSNIGRREAKPVLLATSDSTFIVEEYFSQKDLVVDAGDIDSIQETLEYASDDPVRTYQIFRTETMPTSYASFVDNHLATVETRLSPQKYSTGVSYLDTLRPNVKYYYCGRSIDRHQNISNPTPVTEIELVDNNGQLFINKKIFTFPTTPQRPTISGRRLLAIEPTQFQQAYSLQDSTIGPGQAVAGTAPPSNEIGGAADAVWEKKFKIRLTSQKTGKKMDLNITFKNTGVANP
jgi:hypothetical protein